MRLPKEQKVTALSDVTVVSKSTDEGKSAVIISSTTSANSSLDLDMNGHSLAIDAKTSGIYITKDNTNVIFITRTVLKVRLMIMIL